METTEILNLKKPSENDFYDVKDFNDNMDKLEAEAAKAKGRQVTLLVHAPAGYTVKVAHQSGSYTAVSNTVGKDEYAALMLPFGGPVTINCCQDEEIKRTIEDCIEDGGTIHIMIAPELTTYMSPLAAVPTGTYAAGGPCAPGKASGYVATFCGKAYTFRRASFDELRTDYNKASSKSEKLDAKNNLWHAVRVGMITADNYKAITGEDYPDTAPVRQEYDGVLLESE